MSILPPSSGPWRSPPGDPGLVHIHTTRHGDREITLRPGAAPADITTAMTALPEHSFFTEAFGDVDLVLVFRVVPDDPAAVPAVIPTGPPSAPAAVPTG